MTTYIYGASDDLVEFEGDFREEYPLGSGDKSYFKISDPETGDYIYVYVQFSNLGWLLGVAVDPNEDDKSIVPWEIWYDHEFAGSPYSITLAIETPENVVVTEVNRNGVGVSDD